MLALFPLFLLLVGVLAWLQIKYIYPVFTQLEQDSAIKNFERVVSRFNEDSQTLDKLNRDWASWDDTYAFVQGQNTNYEKANLGVEFYKNGDFDFLMFFNTREELVWHGIYSETADNVVKNKDLADQTIGQLSRKYGTDSFMPNTLDGNFMGLLVVNERPVLFSIRPILKSNNQGPIMGYLIRGKRIDRGLITDYMKQTQVRFKLTAVENANKEITPDLMVEVMDAQTLEVSRYIYSNGVPIILLESYYPRNISLQGKLAVQTALIASVILGVLLLVVQWYVLQVVVLAPISKLKETASSITENQNYRQRTSIETKDEIGGLSLQLNNMLDAIETREEKLQEAMRELKHLSVTDSLTKIPNRLRFDSASRTEWRRMSRDRMPLSIIMCDVDYFKQYNDYYGHIGGDDCLVTIANALAKSVARPADLVARYGGEEFVLLLPNTDIKGAEFIAEKVMNKIAELNIAHSKSDVADHVTVSMGISSVIPNSGKSLRQLLTHADDALYEAKLTGRNRYVSVRY
ncbi:hypothetical protein JCM19232_4041 [Vibrio ishigakensis]|uniref:diguanylate cyclase n=1 Tax=Vibrio ishigakensis TaxID=1481914 RepID=A0A0B8PE38_9VIBR|nr:hypothetical protein JCM19232_4041 [Vibrio ishigakensis]